MRFCQLGFAVLIFAMSSVVQASVVDYNFSGTLNTPIDGTTQFSGSLFYGNAPDNYILQGNSFLYNDFLNHDGSAIQMVINVAGHYDMIQVSSLESEGPDDVGSLQIAHNAYPYVGQDFFSIAASTNSTNPNTIDTAFFGAYVSMGLSLVDPTGTALPTNSPDVFQDLDLSKFSTRESNIEGDDIFISGTITSLTNVSTGQTTTAPEPSTIILFAFLAFGGAAHRRFRHRS